MKYCLNSNQTIAYLKKADEIKLPYKDRDIIIDFSEKYPNASFIIDCFNVNEIDWNEICKYNDISGNKVILCVKTINELIQASELDIKKYLGFPIESFYDLNAITILNPEYIICGPELFFNMDKLKQCGVKIRAIPNIAYQDGLLHGDGIVGTWIRPEDLHTFYSTYIDTIEFEDCDRDKEQALYRVYAEEQEWTSRLDTLFTNFVSDAVGRMVDSEKLSVRLNCNHKCQKGGSCAICSRVMYLANPDLIKDYLQETGKEVE